MRLSRVQALQGEGESYPFLKIYERMWVMEEPFERL